MKALFRQLRTWNALLGLNMSGTRLHDETDTISILTPVSPTGIATPTQTQHPDPNAPHTAVPQPLDIPRPPSSLCLPGPTFQASTKPSHIDQNENESEKESIAIHSSPIQPITLLVPTSDLRTVIADLEGRSVPRALAALSRAEERRDGVSRVGVRRKRMREDNVEEKEKERRGGVDVGRLSEQHARVLVERENERRKKRIRREREREKRRRVQVRVTPL